MEPFLITKPSAPYPPLPRALHQGFFQPATAALRCKDHTRPEIPAGNGQWAERNVENPCYVKRSYVERLVRFEPTSRRMASRRMMLSRQQSKPSCIDILLASIRRRSAWCYQVSEERLYGMVIFEMKRMAESVPYWIMMKIHVSPPSRQVEVGGQRAR